MSWRTVIISNRAKLELRMNYLVVRGNEIRRVYLDEIYILIIESTAVSITASLLCELVKRKITVIFCDEKRLPLSQLNSFYGCHDASGKVREQVSWSNSRKDEIWRKIVKSKIDGQTKNLKQISKFETASLLASYSADVALADKTNREGLAAKVYFSALFGKDFIRGTDTITNIALNYGYAILLSCFAREVVANGYITQLGIFHNNQFNHFNLASDLMEPFRPFVDELVLINKFESFDTNAKRIMQQLLEKKVIISGKEYQINNAISVYCKSIFDYLTYGENEIKLIDNVI